MNSPLIGIIMGSASDIPVVEKGTKVLDELGIPYELAIASAHRTPRDVEAYAANARKRGMVREFPDEILSKLCIIISLIRKTKKTK